MARVCMRPGCDRPAEVRLSYDTVSCQVWLDPIPELPGPVQEICEFHALRLTVPRGWLLCDRRTASPALFVPTVVPVVQALPTDIPHVEAPRVETPPVEATSVEAPPSKPHVPLTVGASTPKVGKPQVAAATNQVKRRHPDATASQLFADALEAEAAEAAPVEAAVPEVAEEADAIVEALRVEPGAVAAESEAVRAGPGVDAEHVVADEVPEEAVPDEAPEEGAPDEPDEPMEPDADRSAPTSPLLARAFAQTGPQRSVLSDDLRVRDQNRSKRRGG